MKAERHLVVFARLPRLGIVKRRLAAGIGPLAATSFYRRTLNDLLRRLGRDRRWRCHLAVTPDRAVHEAPFWPDAFCVRPQGKGDLGARMDRAMAGLPPGPAVLVGADIPDIRAHHIWRAFQALRGADAVFGPAADGGYWLVGLKRSPRSPDVFSDIPWSADDTLARTLDKCAGAGLRVALVDALADVDDAAAYKRYVQACR